MLPLVKHEELNEMRKKRKWNDMIILRWLFDGFAIDVTG